MKYEDKYGDELNYGYNYVLFNMCAYILFVFDQL